MNPTYREKLYWDLLSSVIGCIACRIDGHDNYHVSIHHCEGRTKKGAHMKVLPLCFIHHQGGTKDVPSIHPWKRQFEKRYGTQEDLMLLCDGILNRHDKLTNG